MKVITYIDQYTINKIIAENKRRAEKDIFPSGDITAPVFFKEPILSGRSKYAVIDGKLAIAGIDHKIDFGFRLYDESDGPFVIPEMVRQLNSFIHSFEERGMRIFDNGIFACFDKMFFDLGYVGKMVKAAGIDKNETGMVSVFSYNYAETLITKDSYEYQEYEWLKNPAYFNKQ